MKKSILSTTLSRVVIALINLIIMLINAHYLGASGLGTIGLVVLAITIILVVNNVAGGASMIYLASRLPARGLIMAGYLWAFLVFIVFSIVFLVADMVPAALKIHVLALTLMFALASVHMNLIMGYERIREFNIITTVQYMIQLVTLYILMVSLGRKTVFSYIISLYVSYGFLFITGLILLIPRLVSTVNVGMKDLFRQIFTFGAPNQLAYILQVLNYRLNYYLLDLYTGRAGLGMFHFGNQLSEGTWLAGRSIATVQFARIASEKDNIYARRLTVSLFKLTFIITLLMLGVLMLVPGTIYEKIGMEFGSTRFIILALAVGILANAVSMMFSHYLSGMGKPVYNTISALIGLCFTVFLGFLLIPVHGFIGAAIASSVAYTVVMVCQVYYFLKISGASARELIIGGGDLRFMIGELRKWLKS